MISASLPILPVEGSKPPEPRKNNYASKKGSKTIDGYKDYVAIDPKSDFVSEFVYTPANVHDSRVIDELLEEDEKTIFADKAYDSRDIRRKCREEGKFCGVLAKAQRGRPRWHAKSRTVDSLLRKVG